MTTRDWTATIFIVDQGRTLLLNHRKLGMWLPPGGHIDPHELPHLAAIREAREETGLEIDLLVKEDRRLDGVAVLPQPLCILLEPIEPGHEHIDLIYVGKVVGGSLLQDSNHDEHHEARWFTAAELDHPKIIANVREFGRQAIMSADMISGFLGEFNL